MRGLKRSDRWCRSDWFRGRFCSVDDGRPASGGDEDGDTTAAPFTLDPRLLVFEYSTGMVLRAAQVELLASAAPSMLVEFDTEVPWSTQLVASDATVSSQEIAWVCHDVHRCLTSPWYRSYNHP